MKDKVLYLNSTDFKSFVEKSDNGNDGEIQSIFIEGYASTNSTDRDGDVITTSAWESGIKNYLKNPILLAFHNHTKPAGRMVEHKIDTKGLWVKSRVSSAAGDIYKLVKDEVVTAFSVGFRILDAIYDSTTELFVIKELELVEISLVSVPANQDSLFSLAKSFDTESEYKEFKLQYAPKADTTKGLEKPDGAETTTEGWDMDPEKIAELVAAGVEKALSSRAAAEKAAAEKAAADKAAADALEARIAEQVKKNLGVDTSGSTTGGEKLLADVAKAIEDQTTKSMSEVAELLKSVNEKAEELKAIQTSRMTFTDPAAGKVSDSDKEKAVMLATILHKGIGDTKFGKDLIEKAGAHQASATWELEVSLNMEAEVRRRLVVAPLLRNIAMQTNVMTMPVNPEAGVAQWVTNAQFGTSTSAGNTTVHQLKEITLNAYKVATNEYLAYEEPEDSLLVLLPIIRDAMVRRVARSVDKAFLMGAGAGADPVKGLSIYDATSVVVPTNTGAATVANLRALRKDLGAWGLDPSELVYIVSTDIYYDLLDDTLFQTVDKIGDKATLLTGQIGSIANTPVLVSAELPAKAGGAATASTNIGALCFAPANFIVGNQRGLRFDTQDLVETQRKVFVASLRTGLVQTTTNLGQGVSTLRWS